MENPEKLLVGDFKTDLVGDRFSKLFGKYSNYSGLKLNDLINQTSKNYENVFDEKPTLGDIKNQIKFMDLFLSEISYQCPGRRISQASSAISSLLDTDEPLKTFENIVYYTH